METVTLSRRLKKLSKSDAWRVREFIARSVYTKPSDENRKKLTRSRFLNGCNKRVPKYRVRALDGTVYTPSKIVEGTVWRNGRY